MNLNDIAERDKNEILKFVENKIKDVKCVDQINTDLFLKHGKYNYSVDLNKSLNRDFIFRKKVLQLTINSFNNFELYKNLVVKFMVKDPGTLLGSYFNYDASNDVWRCYRYPNKNEVSDALCNYILCFRSVQQIKNHYDTVKCAYCDEDIPKETDRCEMCDMVTDVKIENKELKEEMEKKIVDKVVDFENEVRNNNNENRHVKKDVKQLIELTDKDTQKPLKNKYNKDESSMNEKNSEMKIINDKWKCGRCEYLNEYTFINCEACEGLYKDGKWNCGKCTMENSCVDNKCGACGENNVNIIDTVVNINNIDKFDSFKKDNISINIADKIKDEQFDFVKKDIKELKVNSTENKENTSNDKWKCGECECMNEYLCDKCKACGGLYKDGKWNCGSCTLENSCVNERCVACGEKNINLKNKKRVNDEMEDLTKNENDRNEFTINNKVIKDKTSNDKWKCGGCECLNEYTFGNCEACAGLYKDGKWNCGICTLENSCVDNICNVCGDKNVNSIDTESRCAEGRVNHDDKFDLLKKGDNIIKLKTDIEIDKDKWNCGKCGMLHLYDLIICNVCGGSRIENGLWKCSQCTMINKCEDKKCKACNTLNNLLKKFKEPSKSIINKAKDAIKKPFQKSDNKDHSKDWQCTFDNCKKENNIDSQYCKYCYLIKDHDLSRGAAIKQKKKDVEEPIWICFKCSTFNKIEEFVCKKKNCRSPRYEKK